MSKTEAPPRRCFLYHETCPKGQIFVGDEAIAEAGEKGWSDKPPETNSAQVADGTQGSPDEQLQADYDDLVDKHALTVEQLNASTAQIDHLTADLEASTELLNAAQAEIEELKAGKGKKK